MAKAIITIEDGDDGMVNVSCEFDPPASGKNRSAAHNAAAMMLESITGSKDVESYTEDVEYVDLDDEEEIH